MQSTVILEHLVRVCSTSFPSDAEMEEAAEDPPQLTDSTPAAAGMGPAARTAAVINGSSRRADAGLYKQRQLSLRETKMEAKWEKRRQQILERNMKASPLVSPAAAAAAAAAPADDEEGTAAKSLTDEDLDELKGSIDLGFVFSEEEGAAQDLCHTLPALNLYFAVNHQVSFESRVQTPTSFASPASSLCGIANPRSPSGDHLRAQADSWKVCHPGDTPQHVFSRSKHWAQAVACSGKQKPQSC